LFFYFDIILIIVTMLTRGFRSLARLPVGASKQFFSSSSLSAGRTMVIVDHDGSSMAESTLNTITAASQIGHAVDAMVLGGESAATVAEQAAKVAGVEQVLVASDAALEHSVAENVAQFLNQLQGEKQYSHILASSSSSGMYIGLYGVIM
jgi:hypothetical protein